MRSASIIALVVLLCVGEMARGAAAAPPSVTHEVPALCTDVAGSFDGDWWPDCVGTLLELRGSGDAGRARLADRELRTIRDPAARPAVEQAIVRADPMGRLALMASLDRLATDASLPMLERVLLDDPDAMLRGRAYVLIGRITGSAPADRVLEALESTLAERRERAAYTAAEVQLERATPLLIDLVRSDLSPAVRIAAVEAFRQVGGDEAEDAVAEALRRDSDEGVKIVAARVLGAIGWRSSEALTQALNDPSSEVRAEVAASLETIRATGGDPEGH